MGIGPEPALPLSLAGLAGLVGRYLRVEEGLFAVLGGCLPAVAGAEAKMMLSAHGYHHAWHAELWQQRRPEAAVEGGEPEPPGGHPLEALGAALAASGAPGSTLEVLVGTYRVVVPRLITAYRRHLDQATPLSDGPVIRALRLVLADEVADWQEGEGMLQGLLGTTEQVERAAAYQARLESLLVPAGGVAGNDRALPGRKS